MYRIIQTQLKQPQFDNFTEFTQAALEQNKANSLHATLAVSLRATSIGQAFSIAYRSALQALLPSLNPHQWAAMCVTEAQGNHPKLLETKVTADGVVTGHKSFVSMGILAGQLIVVAKIDDPQANTTNRSLLKAVLVQQPAQGVHMHAMENMNLVPDVPHASMQLDNVQGVMLPGDGHTDYSKRFRYLEDIHVLMSFVTLILSTAVRNRLPLKISEQCIVLISALESQELLDEPWQHLHLGEAFKTFEGIVREFEKSFEGLSASFKADWLRDKKLFLLANKARQARTEKARTWLANSYEYV
jgi:acyl-CoA dehydrogenase